MKVQTSHLKPIILALAMLLGTHAQAQLVVDFSANATSSCSTPFTVQFTDLSTSIGGSATSWFWHFGNGANSTQQNPTAQYNAPGSYNVKLIVYDNLGSGDSITKFGYITIGNNINLTATYVPVTCFNNGEVTVSANGGTAPYTYQWANGQTTATATGLSAYHAQFGIGVTVTDAMGCTHAQVFAPPYTPTLNVSATVSTAPSCGGGTNGEITLSVGGGSAPYEFSLDGNTWQTTNVFSGLSAGDIGYFIRDNNGCMIHDTVTVSEPTFAVTLGLTTPITCDGLADGIITSAVSGGNVPYTYYWLRPQAPGPPPPPPGPGDYFLDQVDSGFYSITVVDANGCTGQSSIYVSDPDPIMPYGMVTDATCPTCADGIIDVAPSGGTGLYTYAWSNGATTTTVNNLLPGVYTVTVTDVNGCTGIRSFDVNPGCHHAFTPLATNPTCYTWTNGTISITPDTTLHMPWTYNWSNGSTNSNLSWLPAGNYNLTITDTTGCASVHSFTLTHPDSLLVTASVTNTSCSGCNDGAIDLTVVGGTPPYSYMWVTGATTEDIINAVIGTYTVTVTDDNGCQTQAAPTVLSNTTCNLTVSLGNDTALCFGALSLVPNISNATNPPFTYVWSTGETAFNITVFNGGVYSVTVTDGIGCTASDTIVVSDLNPGAFANGDTTICLGGTAQLSATGGTAYEWGPATGLSDPFSANPLASPQVTTTYWVEIDNGTGCVSGRSVTITVDDNCTWPGDANNDGIADNDDILAIGLAYGDNGPARSNASLVWEAQPAINWANSLPSGTNHKHADTNGDGVVNDDDTLAITLNYGLTHLKTEEEREASMPALYIVLPDSIGAGQTVQGQLYLGSDSFPLANFYGIKFSMNYNPGFIEEGTVSFHFNNSWMGTPGTDLLTFQKDLHSSGRIDGAVTGTNRINRNGFGAIGYANLTMKDDISGKNTIAEPMTISFTNIRAISANETLLDVNGEETTVIATQVVGIGQVPNTLPVSIYPNPSQGTVYINTFNRPIAYITLHNTLGMVVQTNLSESNGVYQLNTANLSAGVYTITIQSGNEVTTQRIILNK